jgi:hypothetical protein
MESTCVPDLTEIAVYLGLDVGKGEHHAVALTPVGRTLHDKALPSEPKLRAPFAKLARHGQVLVAIDQPASIGALPVTVARDAGCTVVYLPGLTMRRIADLYPGDAKTDARSARVIADAARTMPHTLRNLEPDDETPPYTCSSDMTTTSRPKRRGPATASAACSPPSTRTSNGSSARASPTPRCSAC